MEAADGQTNNAKVIVQFADPSNLFDDVAPLLQNRLPLGNLHWKSPTRPLRSIEELDISLDREAKQAPDGANAARRHQIPGLRQTPFVKVLLLRCDDKEKYKESARKEVKDWVKGLGFSTSGKGATNRQERHDAYEYLILHVVLPGTPAAAQPKSSKHISAEAAESTDSVNSKSKWTGKGTSTIFDKLRADFSSSSKTPFERIAQIRLLDHNKPNTVLSPLELEQQWQDLIEKLKVAILQSFDVRVTQYEDDIRERESQRNLPGWNFCTFFILKEGLARGFENVGLLEDALQIYEELDVGLDAVIQEQATTGTDATNVLLPFAVDLKDTIRTVLGKKENDQQPQLAVSLQIWAGAEANRFPWRLERRNYQNMILTNQVSVLDFRIYIFIRQMQILLRQASMPLPPSRPKSMERQNTPRWDADLLSKVCERSVRFMNLAARNLRQDLLAAWGGQEGLAHGEAIIQQVAIDNIVASWKWASLLQTLGECQIISSLAALSTRLHDHDDGELFDPKDIINSRMRADSVSTVTSDKSVNGATPDIFAMLRVAKGSKSGLIFQAAELFSMLRTIFLDLCWQAGLLRFLGKPPNRVTLISDAIGTGILAPSLQSMLRSEDVALAAYKLLTVCACQCYTSASKPRASRQLLFDLAKLELQKKNMEAAVGWLDAVPGFLESPPVTWMDRSMLELYINFLRDAGRDSDLVKSLFLHIQSKPGGTSDNMQQMWEEMSNAAVHTESLNLNFNALFDVEEIDGHLTHDEVQNTSLLGLTIGVKVSVEDLGPAHVTVHCQGRDQQVPATLSFDYRGSLKADNGRLQIFTRCGTSTEGWYDVVSIILRIANVTYKHDLRPASTAQDEETPALGDFKPPTHSFYMYLRNDLPALTAIHAPLVDLSTKRNILVSVIWKSSNATSAQLRLKPATAGLRLDLQSAYDTVTEQSVSIERQDDAHVLLLGGTSTSGGNRFEIPYSLNGASLASVSLRAELSFTTENGSFQLCDLLTLMVLLPVDVNVQDMFQTGTAYSRFTISPSRYIPIEISHCVLTSSDGLEITDGNTWEGEPVQAFPKQPVNWVVRTTRGIEQPSHGAHSQKMSLQIAYRCFDEIVQSTILHSFESRLKTTKFAYGLRPLTTHLSNRLQTLWTESEIEVFALTGEIEMWEFDDFNWPSILCAFCKIDRLGLEGVLRDWHDTASATPLALRTEGVPDHRLRLVVDPPETQIIVTTRLQPLSAGCVVGQACAAKISVAVNSFSRQDLEGIEVSLEVPSQNQNTLENWLIGGQRKGSFRASSNFESTIILLAQRTGQLVLPGIEIRCRYLGERAGAAVAFETEHLSIATAIRVRGAVEATTVGIAEGEGQEKHWLVKATRAH